MFERLQLRYGDDPTQGFILQLVLLPALKVGCDALRVTRCHRRLQGKGSGVPLTKAAAYSRPAERHRELPPGSVAEWAQSYVDSRTGNLTAEAEAAHVVDKLTQYYQGACAAACSGAAPKLTRILHRLAGETLAIMQAWRADCLEAEVPPPAELWAHIRYRGECAALAAPRSSVSAHAVLLTQPLRVVAPLRRFVYAYEAHSAGQERREWT